MLLQLKKIIEEYEMMNKSMELLWISFNKYQEEERKEFEKYFKEYNKEKLKIYYNSIFYKIKNWTECDYQIIVINLDIYYNGKNVGYFDACYNLLGEYEDEYLVLY